MRAGNDEGPTVAAATPQEQTTADAAIVVETDLQRKGMATIQAEAALRGVEMLRLQDGRIVASLDGSWFKVIRRERDLAHFLGWEWLA